MNPNTNSAQFIGKFKRLAALEIRFIKKKKLWKVVNQYCDLLGLTPRPDPDWHNVQPSYSYKIGQGSQAMQLLFVLRDDGSNIKKNRTILYWEVPAGELDAIHSELCAPTTDPDMTPLAIYLA
jgi:hypothetical protein